MHANKPDDASGGWSVTVCQGVRSFVLKISVADIASLNVKPADPARTKLFGTSDQLGLWRVEPAAEVRQAIAHLARNSRLSPQLVRDLLKLQRFIRTSKSAPDVWIGVG